MFFVVRERVTQGKHGTPPLPRERVQAAGAERVGQWAWVVWVMAGIQSQPRKNRSRGTSWTSSAVATGVVELRCGVVMEVRQQMLYAKSRRGFGVVRTR